MNGKTVKKIKNNLLRLCQLYIKTFMCHILKMAVKKKLKHVAVMIFYYILNVLT